MTGDQEETQEASVEVRTRTREAWRNGYALRAAPSAKRIEGGTALDLLLLILIVLLVLALVGGYAVSNLLWIVAVIVLAVLLWRVLTGRRAV